MALQCPPLHVLAGNSPPCGDELVVAGAGATAICADLGAHTIREEIDALRVLGIDPIQRLVVPRVLASTAVALLLNGLGCAVAADTCSQYCCRASTPGPLLTGLRC